MRSPIGSRSSVPRAAVLGLLVTLGVAGSGCQHSRSFFQMDSNSRVPFFGMDFTPSWPRRESSVSEVSRLQSGPVEGPVETSEAAAPAGPASLALPVSGSLAARPTAVDAPVERFR